MDAIAILTIVGVVIAMAVYYFTRSPEKEDRPKEEYDPLYSRRTAPYIASKPIYKDKTHDKSSSSSSDDDGATAVLAATAAILATDYHDCSRSHSGNDAAFTGDGGDFSGDSGSSDGGSGGGDGGCGGGD